LRRSAMKGLLGVFTRKKTKEAAILERRQREMRVIEYYAGMGVDEIRALDDLREQRFLRWQEREERRKACPSCNPHSYENYFYRW
jgi:hypothetical protein